MLILVFYSIIMLPLIIMMPLMPYVTRKTESFGVSIPEKEYSSSLLRKLRAGYRNSMLLITGILYMTVCALLLNSDEKVASLIFSVSIYGVLLCMGACYLIFHNKMKRIKHQANWKASRTRKVVIDTEFRNRRLLVSPWWFLLYPVIIGLTIVIPAEFYEKIPREIPINYNLAGEGSEYVQKLNKPRDSYGVGD